MEVWEVVGGADRGGIIVRSGQELASPPEVQRLATGALVERKELVGERLRFRKLSGRGPESGWVSTRLRDKELLVLANRPGEAPAEPPGPPAPGPAPEPAPRAPPAAAPAAPAGPVQPVPSADKRIWFVRHGEAEHNVLIDQGLPSSHLRDPGLSQYGREQARGLAADALLRGSALGPPGAEARAQLVISSPCRRALETATELARGAALPVFAWPDLQECTDNPCDTGRPRAELEQEFPGVDLSALQEDTRMTCLMLAVIHGELDAVSFLMTRKAKPEQRDSLGWTAVHFAVQTGRGSMVSALHHFKADLSIATNEGDTAHHLAARADDGNMVRLLAAGRCSVNAKTSLGEQPLQVAARWGSAAAFYALAACGADTRTQDAEGRSLLGLAAVHGHVAVAQAALEPSSVPPELEAPPEDAHVPEDARFGLIRAARGQPGGPPRGRGSTAGRTATPPQAAAGDPLVADIAGRIPLALAAASGRLDVLRLLLERRSPANAADAAGSTPLILAASLGRRAAVECLLAAGAKASVRNKAGLDAARAAADPALRELLQQQEQQPKQQQQPGKGAGGAPGQSPPPRPAAAAPPEVTVYRLRLERLPLLLHPEELEARLRDVLRGPLGDCAAEELGLHVPLHPITERLLGYAYADLREEAEAKRLWRWRDPVLDGVRMRIVSEGARSAPPAEGP